jgi:hypothetical protein
MQKCIRCGFTVRDGRLLCPVCEGHATPDAILPDGTPLYLKTGPTKPEYASLQLELYDMLSNYKRALYKED